MYVELLPGFFPAIVRKPHCALGVPLIMSRSDSGRAIRFSPLFAACILLLAWPSGMIYADYLCDCSRVVNSCSANVNLEGMQLSISSSTPECSRIDYLVDGQPYTTLIVGGQERLPWPGPPLRNARIVVENCRVCAEAITAGAADIVESKSAETERSAEAFAKVLPEYPRLAWMNQREGDVLVEFTVSEQGSVQNIKVLQSGGPELDVASVDAISRYRYRPAVENGKPAVSIGMRERFRFRLLNGSPQVSVTAP